LCLDNVTLMNILNANNILKNFDDKEIEEFTK